MPVGGVERRAGSSDVDHCEGPVAGWGRFAGWLRFDTGGGRYLVFQSPVIPTVPKPAPERTFVVAATILGIFALLQLIGAIAVLAPQVRFSTATSSTGSNPGVPAPGTAPVAGLPASPDEAIVAANRFLAEADAARSRGDLQGALEALAEADHVYPNDPGILFQMGMMLEDAGQRVEAENVYQAIVALPADPGNPARADFGAQAEARLQAFSTGAPGAPPATLMRDGVGIPIGSLMGIVDSRIVEGEAGYKNLRVATKASPAETIDPGELQVAVFFYEQNDQGEILRSDSSVQSEWLSPPTDWSNDEPELVDIRYSMPADDRGDLPPLQYYGYVMGIYYKGELQDSRAEPVALLDEFQLKLTLRDDDL